MSTVRLLLELKGARIGKREPLFVDPSDLVIDAIDLMWDNKVGSVLVMKEGELLGILTERDCLGKLEREKRLATWAHVEEIMTPSPLETVSLLTTLEEAARRFESEDGHSRRHLPVIENGKVIDVISERDLIYALLAYGWSLEDNIRGVMEHRT